MLNTPQKLNVLVLLLFEFTEVHVDVLDFLEVFVDFG